MLAGLEEELASPRCSDEEQHALAKITAACTLAKPHTIIALLSASVLDFDPEAMALTEPTGTIALSVAEADGECMVAVLDDTSTSACPPLPKSHYPPVCIRHRSSHFDALVPHHYSLG